MKYSLFRKEEKSSSKQKNFPANQLCLSLLILFTNLPFDSGIVHAATETIIDPTTKSVLYSYDTDDPQTIPWKEVYASSRPNLMAGVKIKKDSLDYTFPVQEWGVPNSTLIWNFPESNLHPDQPVRFDLLTMPAREFLF